MDSIENKLESTSKEIEYFEHMVTGAEKLIKPWKVALILTNLFWAIALAAFIAFAYLTPAEMEQSQDFPAQQQEQTIKGG